jgi:murein DD-endopeptidase MepM/ murein hydrolase activator NlpD
MRRMRYLRPHLGDEPPLLADGRRAPDRREVSLRWLSGSFLTGITSCALMGVALFAAVDGREQLALPGEAAAAANPAAESAMAPGASGKGGRVVAPLINAKPADRTIVEVSTMFREGDREIVRRRPFAHVKAPLAVDHAGQRNYPKFDPLAIFSSGETVTEAGEDVGVIYGAEIDSEISLRTLDFPVDGSPLEFAGAMTVDEAEETVRNNGSILTDGTVQVAALHYVDPRRFAASGPVLDFSAGLNARVITENVSVAAPSQVGDAVPDYVEDVIVITEEQQIYDAMLAAGYDDAQSTMVSSIFSTLHRSTLMSEGQLLRLALQRTGEVSRIVRTSIYDGRDHVVTLAESDSGYFVRAVEPPPSPIIDNAVDDVSVPLLSGRDLPTIYDGVYRAALSYGMTLDMTAQIVRLLAANVDFQARLRSTDTLEAFFAVDDESGQATDDSELLYVNARFGDSEVSFYRFRNPEDDTIDYYDAEGRSVRQFLLRNPVPNGRFTSSFGMRRHPILGYSRMHSGVDWAAPTGTPIIASGNGVVESAGWHSGGYGRHTVIRHANGYVSSYSHQNRIAEGVSAGARVTQGQVIGYVGSTGLSTGPHLHYELEVNGSKVDPMRVRLPDARSLEGSVLAEFQRERERIADLLGVADETELADLR